MGVRPPEESMAGGRSANRTPGVRRRRGRPRINPVGSRMTYTSLGPDVRAAVDALAGKEKRSTSLMLAILVEEALKARRRLT